MTRLLVIAGGIALAVIAIAVLRPGIFSLGQGGGRGAPTTTADGTIPPGESGVLSFPFDSVDRAYILHVPANYDGRAPLPLMISYHGSGGTGRGQQEKTGFDAIADAEGFFVAYPDSNPEYRSGGQWQTAGAGNDIEFSKALIAALADAYAIDTSRVYVSGFSMGGGMAQAMACEAADMIAGMAYASNTFGETKAEACAPARPIAVVGFAGTADVGSEADERTESGHKYSYQETAEFWAEANGCAGGPVTTAIPDTLTDGREGTSTRQVWTGCKEGTSVTLYTIEGGGHAWPGSPDVGKVGPASTAIDASRLIWETLSLMRR